MLGARAQLQRVLGAWPELAMATMRVLCSLLMVVVTWAREVFPIEKPFDEETLRDAEAILRKDCGESCVEARACASGRSA